MGTARMQTAVWTKFAVCCVWGAWFVFCSMHGLACAMFLSSLARSQYSAMYRLTVSGSQIEPAQTNKQSKTHTAEKFRLTFVNCDTIK